MVAKGGMILIMFLVWNFQLMGSDITEIRKWYKEAPENEDRSEKLWKLLSDMENPSALILAYKGATRAIMAKHAWMVTSKYSMAKEGIKILHEAVGKEKENIEIRYLRFTIEYHLPSFLALSKDLEEDKEAFVKYMSKRKNFSIPESHFIEMARFFIDSGKCTEEEISKIKSEAGL